MRDAAARVYNLNPRTRQKELQLQSAHLIRFGACVILYAMGFTASQIKFILRWKSMAFLVYLRNLALWHANKTKLWLPGVQSSSTVVVRWVLSVAPDNARADTILWHFFELRRLLSLDDLLMMMNVLTIYLLVDKTLLRVVERQYITVLLLLCHFDDKIRNCIAGS